MTVCVESLEALLDSANELVQAIAPSGHLLYTSPGWQKMLGYSSIELTQLSFFDLVQWEDRDRCRRTFDRVQAGAGDCTMQLRLVTQAGTPVSLSGRVNLQVNQDAPEIWSLWHLVEISEISEVSISDPLLDRGSDRRPNTIGEMPLDAPLCTPVAEEGSWQRQACYRAIVDEQPDLICRFMPDGTVTFMNQAYCQELGKRAEDLIGHNFFSTVPELDQATSWHHWAALALSNPVVTYERRVLSAEGILRWREWTDRGFFDAQGNLVEIQAMGRDITNLKLLETSLRRINTALEHEIQQQTTVLETTIEQLQREVRQRQRAEAALQESEARFRAVSDASPLGIFVTDAEGHYLYTNRAYQAISGLAPHETLGDGWAAAIHPADRQRVLQGWYNAAQSQTLFKTTQRFRHKNGRVIWASVQTAAMQDGDHLLGYVGTVEDITERRQAEKALKKAYAEQRALFAAMEDLVMVRDAQGRCTKIPTPKANPLQYTPIPELLGKTLHDTFPQDMADTFLGYIQQALATQTTVKAEYSLRFNQQETWFDASISPIDMHSVIWVTHDITNRKKAQIEVLQALQKERELNELKSRFVTMVSHEIRTPLTSIVASADILQNVPCNEVERQELFAVIHGSTEHMVQLLENVLSIGLADTGKLEFHPTRFDIGEFCRNLAKELERGLGRNHHLQFIQAGDDSSGVLDKKLLRQILSNLLSNAFKYSPPGSQVCFHLLFQDGQASFQIQDQGIGIPPEERSRLFECFHRAGNVGAINGTGLGLAIVRNCVDRHGGSITVESELGQGTTFTVTLPLNPKAGRPDDLVGD